jgi:gas vesicle protein
MRKILFGAILGALAMYFLDPGNGGERRQMLSGLWREQKDTVLDAARTTASTVSSVSQDVGTVVGEKLNDIRPGGSEGASNGSPAGAELKA